MVLLAPSDRELQDRFAAECEAAGMDRRKMDCLLQVAEEILSQVEEFKFLGLFFTSEGKME